MFIIYDFVACLFVALIAATLLCTAYAIFLLLKSEAARVSRKLQELAQGAPSPIADNFLRGTFGKPLTPAQVPVNYGGEGRK
jgi:hypothetical protein